MNKMFSFSQRFFIVFIFSLFFCGTTFASTIARPMSNSGLVGYWNFEEGKGNAYAYDRSGFGNNGTLINGPISTSSNTGLGQALNFDGVDDYVQIGKPQTLDFSGTDKITLTGWVYPTGSGNYPAIIAKQDGSSGQYSFVSGAGSDLKPALWLNVGGWGLKVQALNAINLNTWTYVAVTYDGVNAKIYLNGVLNNSSALSGNMAADTGNVYIGLGNAIPYIAVGKLDEVRVYNRALSGDEISRLYKIQKPKVAGGVSNTGLVGYWPLDEGYGTKTRDTSFNSNDGTLVNSPVWGTGKAGKALSFTGSDKVTTSYVQTAVTAYTIAAWIKVPVSQSSYFSIVQNRGSDGSGKSLTFGIDGSGACGAGSCIGVNKLMFGEDSNSIFIGSAGSTSLNDNQWHYVVGTWSAASGAGISQSQFKVYVDGIENTASFRTTGGDVSPLTGHANGTVIGYHDSWSSGAVGQIDDMRIYSRVLSDSEIYNLYKGSKASVVGKSKTDRLTNGLVGYWTFDGNKVYGTTAYDSSSSGNNGTLTNGPKPVLGKIGQSLNFDGSDDYVGTINSISNPTTYSISVWFKTTAASGKKIVGFESDQSGTVSVSYDRHIYIGTDGKIYFGWYPGVLKSVVSSATLNDGKWHHAVGTHDGTRGILYIDGVSQGADVSSGGASYNGYWRIGSYKLNTWTNAPDGYFTGSIDDVRIYDRAINTDEVKALYNTGK